MPLLRPTLFLLPLLVTFTSAQYFNNSVDQKILNAIENENYNFIENSIDNNTTSPNARINGKTLLIYACIYDQPEMVLLLLSKGADLNLVCDLGMSAEEYAVMHNSIYALAQIIVVKA